MNTHEILHFIRKNKKLLQRDILRYMDSSVYSKIESGNRNLQFSELVEILGNLAIPLDEFFQYLDINAQSKQIRELLEEYRLEPTSLDIKKKICDYFYELKFSIDISLDELSNYIFLKVLFSDKWVEIPSISDDELEQIFQLLNEKKYYFHYDYAILSNTIYLFNDEQIKNVMSKAFPVKDMQYRNAATKEFITNLICNLITTLLRRKEYDRCSYYLALANEEKENYDIQYKIMLDFLENLTDYLQTKDIIKAERLFNHINYLTSIKEYDFAQALKGELDSMLDKEQKQKIIFRNQFNKQR